MIDAVELGSSGEIVEGTIEGFEDCSVVQMETERGWREIGFWTVNGLLRKLNQDYPKKRTSINA